MSSQSIMPIEGLPPTLEGLPPTLQHLPPELLKDIFRRCSNNDINALRLTNRHLSGVATDHLPTKFVICYNKHSIERAATIGEEHEKLAKNVKSLWLHTGRISNYQDRDAWAEAMRPLLERDLNDNDRVGPGLTTDTKNMRLAYTAYRALLRDQNHLDKSDILGKSLSAFFRACPKLSQLCIGLDHWIPRAIGRNHSVLLQGLVEPSHGPKPETLIQVLSAAADAKCAVDSLLMENVTPLFYEQFEKVMQAPRTAQCGDQRPGEMPPHGIPWLLRGLKKLQLRLDFIRSSADSLTDLELISEIQAMQAIYQSGKVTAFLRHAPDLRVLSLSLAYTRVDLQDMLGNLKFPKVEVLSVHGGFTEPEYLGEVLLRHRDSLANVRLGDFRQENADREWSQFFQSIAGKLPLLRNVKLRGEFGTLVPGFMGLETRVDYRFSRSPYGCPFGRQMSSYIKSGIGAMPVQDDESKCNWDIICGIEEKEIEFLGGNEDPWNEKDELGPALKRWREDWRSRQSADETA